MKAIILLCSMLIGKSFALNGSYCCTAKEEIWVDDNDSKQCVNVETKATMKIYLNCPENMTYLVSKEYLPYQLNHDGSLEILLDHYLEVVGSVKTGDYCLGYQSEGDGVVDEVVLVCQDEMEPEVVSNEVLGYCMAVSSVFLALTALVYLAFPELRDLQGKIIISLCTTQAVAYALCCLLHVMVYSHMTWCAVRGFLAYYFIISAYFWMNAIAVQIFLSLKNAPTSNDGWKKFLWYALYAWGTPAVLTIILIIINYHPGTHVRPGIGYSHCWFFDFKRTWIYMYSVLAILMAANTAIFIYISVILWKQTFKSSQLKTLRYKFGMMLKLFIIMGLPWIFEMVTSFTPAHMFWVIIDMINCLQGLIVFLILVVFRRRAIKALYNRNALFCLTRVGESYVKGVDDEETIVTPTTGVPMEETGHI